MGIYFELDFSDFSDVGRKRDHNEDYAAFFVPEKEEEKLKSGSLFVVADGVGGAAKGEVASKYAAEIVVYEYFRNPEMPPKNRLIAAFRKANRDIHAYAAENGHFTKMATTMVAAVVVQNNLIVANVGDSRAYLLRGGKITQISRDHSVVAEMVRDGVMTEGEARVSKAKNRLSRSIGGEPEVSVDVYPPIPLQKGDKILLCSDGLTRYAQPDDLLRMTASGSLADATKRMIQFANKSGGADNVTAVVMETVAKSKTRKKIPSRREKRPILPEWQAADTQYPQVRDTISRKRKSAIPIIIGISLVSVISLYIFFSQPKWLVTIVGTPVDSSENVDSDRSNTEIPVTPEPTPQETVPNIGKESVDELPDGTSTDENQVGNTDNIPESKNGDDQPPEEETTRDKTIVEDWKCVYQIKPGPGLAEILAGFNLVYDDNKNYFFYDSCVLYENDSNKYKECNGLKEIDFHEDIEAGKYLVVYNSTLSDDWKPEDCSIENSNGYQGKLFFPTNQGGSE